MSVTLWAALGAAIVVVGLLELIVPPRRRLGGRIAPYVALARPRLGAGPMDLSVLAATSVDDRPAIARVFQPVVHGASISDTLGPAKAGARCCSGCMFVSH